MVEAGGISFEIVIQVLISFMILWYIILTQAGGPNNLFETLFRSI